MSGELRKVSRMSEDMPSEVKANHAVVPTAQQSPLIRREGALALGATAIGALAIGAIAIGAVAIGKIAIGELDLGRARMKKGHVNDLVIDRLRVRELTIERLR